MNTRLERKNAMKRKDIITRSRMAGQVIRFHTWPVHHRQTVGEHTWQVMRIYYQIWGPLPTELTTYFIWHDAGELFTGDIPFPVKRDNPDLKRIMDVLEDIAVEAMLGGKPHNRLANGLQLRAKACDLIDMHEAGMAEVIMGNQFAQPIVDDTFAALEKLPLSPEDGNAVFKYLAKERIHT
jgi:hypothetical protein